MPNLYDTILGLTTESPIGINKQNLVRVFANELGWTPSYDLTPSNEGSFVNMHLVVEHGLENSAILSFLKTSYSDLNDIQRKELLNISYNNMVDWHIQIDRYKITYVYNRLKPSDNIIQEYFFKKDDYEQLRSDAFEKIIGEKRSPNIPALDDVLIKTISYWKRNISAELNNDVSNEHLSALFNSIIFIRSLEDYNKRFKPDTILTDRILLKAFSEYKGNENFTGIIKLALKFLKCNNVPQYLLDNKSLTIFDTINPQLISYLLTDFYVNRNNSFYNYDFSIMSKHALSRIYEKYSALLKIYNTSQLTLYPNIPEEEINKLTGAIYTPEYIARFFAKFLKENLAPAILNKIKIVEPAVGSGIFLRSLLEIKCDPRQEGIDNAEIKQSFQDILGIDVDENACKATELSLATLQLFLTGEFPDKLNIVKGETIQYIESHPSIKGTYDVVVSNPPFIRTENQSFEMKGRISNYMKNYANGRIDTYLAFLKVGLELLKPGGFGLFVLPHSFLISESSHTMRTQLLNRCWIRCVADLSAIPVFGNTGIYITLLIFQKRTTEIKITPKTTIVICKDFVGKALQDAIKANFKENNFYSVYEVDQNIFKNEWQLLPEKENRIQEKIKKYPPLSSYLEARQGFVTGADDVFIIKKDDVPKGEEKIYIPYLPDKKIDRYSIPKTVNEYLFFPFLNGNVVDIKTMKADFSKTWKYLLSKEKYLTSKSQFNNENWWKPLRTRQPNHILRMKIVTPYLSIVPRFALDIAGKYGISRSTYFIAKDEKTPEKELLFYFLAVLNSTPCYWYVSNHSHKYAKGYTTLNVNTFKATPVPDPSSVSLNIRNKIIALVTKRMKTTGLEAHNLELELDRIVCDLYNLTDSEKKILGV